MSYTVTNNRPHVIYLKGRDRKAPVNPHTKTRPVISKQLDPLRPKEITDEEFKIVFGTEKNPGSSRSFLDNGWVTAKKVKSKNKPSDAKDEIEEDEDEDEVDVDETSDDENEDEIEDDSDEIEEDTDLSDDDDDFDEE